MPTTKRKKRCWTKEGLWGDCSCSKLADVIHCRNCGVYEAEAVSHMNDNKALDNLPTVVSDDVDVSSKKTKAYFVFKCANAYFALPPSVVGEITSVSEVHRIPYRSGKTIEGLSNINGELVLVIDIYTTFGLLKPSNFNGLMVLCKIDGDNIAFKTDTVIGVKKVDASEIVEVADAKRKFICSEFSLNNMLNIGVLDIELLTSAIINRII